MTPEGKIRLTPKRKSIEDWTVTLHNHHQGYINWDEYLENQKILESNLTHGEGITLSGAAREGLALLQGLLICGHSDCVIMWFWPKCHSERSLSDLKNLNDFNEQEILQVAEAPIRMT